MRPELEGKRFLAAGGRRPPPQASAPVYLATALPAVALTLVKVDLVFTLGVAAPVLAGL